MSAGRFERQMLACTDAPPVGGNECVHLSSSWGLISQARFISRAPLTVASRALSCVDLGTLSCAQTHASREETWSCQAAPVDFLMSRLRSLERTTACQGGER
jgi:hypothetical protein